ncbi:MAG: cation diffusion facilitator family transporter [Thaumarchaeota archaeon]|nr:cation diffusion facilitator family transporter [Nitrososphaerota archaeon]
MAKPEDIKMTPNESLKISSGHSEKIKIAITSIIASSILTIIKLVVGTSTNSLGILSEAMHSGLDVIAALMTFYAIRMAARPPDLRYTYGYAKYESLTSLAEIILLFAVAGWVFYEGIERIFFKTVHPEITFVSLGIMFVSIGMDFGRSRALDKIAKKYGSQALEADALHFKADMITSAIVVAGLLAVLVLNIPNADAYAAIVVAGMIIYTSLGLGRRTLDVLLDKAPKGVYAQVVESVTGLEGVNKAHDIRVRQVGPEIFVDMHIEVPRTHTHSKAHEVATAVEERVRRVVPNADVMVHVDAIEGTDETIMDRVRLVAAETEGIKNVHSTYLSSMISPEKISDYKKESLHLYLDVQMDGNLDLKKAHDIIDEFEKNIKDKIPEIGNITTHIETESNENIPVGTEKTIDKSHAEKIRNLALSVQGVTECKDIGSIIVNDELHITITIKIAPKENNVITVEDAHKIATDVQNLIINQMGASRVIVHTEPA